MAADLQVGPQNPEQVYGILIYDVPSDHQKLYYHILTKIRKRAIRLNLSVYLFLWSMKDELEKIVEEAKIECPGQNAVVFIAKFDNNEKETLRDQARLCLIRDVEGVGKRLLASITEAQEKANKEGKDFKHLREAYVKQMQTRLEEAHGLAVLFGLTHDIKHAMETSQRIFAGELTKILSEKQINRSARKAAKSKQKAAETLGATPQNSYATTGPVSPKVSWMDVV